VATIDLVSEPTVNRVCAVTTPPVVTLVTPYDAVVARPFRSTPIAAPGIECLDAWSCSSRWRFRSFTRSD
jgi:hypothetical protein